MKHYQIHEIGLPLPTDQYDIAIVLKGLDVWHLYRHAYYANKAMNAARPTDDLLLGLRIKTSK